MLQFFFLGGEGGGEGKTFQDYDQNRFETFGFSSYFFLLSSPLTLTFILTSVIPSFHLCCNAEKEATKSKGRSVWEEKKKNPTHWLSVKTSASSSLFVFSYANLKTVEIPERVSPATNSKHIT